MWRLHDRIVLTLALVVRLVMQASGSYYLSFMCYFIITLSTNENCQIPQVGKNLVLIKHLDSKT